MAEQTDPVVEEILAQHKPEVRAVAEALRTLVRRTAPHLKEEGKPGWSNIVYRGRGVVCAISPHKDHVNLHFYKGTALQDPEGLLEGSGKALRHVKVRRLEDLPRQALERLLRQAVALEEG